MSRETDLLAAPRRLAGWAAVACLLGGLLLAPAAGATASARPAEARAGFAGMRLAAALERLQAEGLPVFFSSNVVTDAMRVVAEPHGATPRQLLDALLEPHGLRAAAGPKGRLIVVRAERPRLVLRGRVVERGSGRPVAGVRIVVDGRKTPAASAADGSFWVAGFAAGAHTVEAYRPGYVVGRWEGVEAGAAADPARLFELDPAPLAAERIVVTADRAAPAHGEPFGALVVAPGRTEDLPHLGDDVFRAVDLLPGAARPESSARLSIRGGRDDELLVVLDGLELFAPFHLQEFDSALSIVPPGSLDRIELMAGGYPVEYGDRMSGVLDMTSVAAGAAPGLELGVGSLYAEAAAAESFGGGRGHLFATARGGTYRLALEVHGRHENPHYWDTFGKVDYRLSPRQELQLDVLAAEDELALAAAPAGESYRSRWRNSYVWLPHTATLGASAVLESIVSVGHLDRSRAGRSAAASAAQFAVEDERSLDFAGLKSVWRFEPRERFSVAGGVELREIVSRIDYLATREGAFALLAPSERGTPPGTTRFAGEFDFEQAAAFASARLWPRESLTVETGLRFDRTGFNEESHVSPRLNIAWSPTPRHVLRLAWGGFYQSQRPYELQVEDGETAIARAERAEHRALGFEHRQENGASWRVDLYERRLTRSRVRYENLFDPAVLFPELAGDRVRLAPDRGGAAGIELLYRSPDRLPFRWSASYTLSSVADQVDGRQVPRAVDQPQAFHLDLGYRLRDGWSVDAAFLYHTGWPTTALDAGLAPQPDGTLALAPVLGPVRGERLPDYHRLDVRVSRSWDLPRGVLTALLDLQNVYDRHNVRGFEDLTLALGAGGEPLARSRAVSWGGFLPTFGIRWRL